LYRFRSALLLRSLHKNSANSVLTGVKFEIDEELWYGASSDEAAEAEASKSMAARMGRIVGAKPFPAAAQRLSQITRDPNCQMDEVVAVLESDPALSARLLRLVNSVGFSLRTSCTSVRHAAALVGTEKLNQVASTAAILDMYESGSQRAKELLEHATVVGALCRYLAFHFGLPPDELFTCGFLHDIGKLMLLDTEGVEYLDLLGPEMADFDTTFVEERKRYGFDHALLAGHVLAAWNIPHPVPKVVAWHHHVTRAYAESTAISQMVSTLRLADAMSFALSKPDTEVQIETLARMEAASYMDISEGQLAAMWDEVRALTERARAVFRGEKVEDAQLMHTSRPSGASLRAVARAKNLDRVSSGALSTPAASERSRQFPCVACGSPSYAQRCAACHGYMCPLHVAGEDEWCTLCQRDYEEAGIPAIRPIVSTLFGALAGALVAGAFFGAASAGAQRPLRIMIGPTLILMLLGMLAGVGQRWVRRWWFLESRPSRASVVPKAVETLLGSAAQHSPQIVEIDGPPDAPSAEPPSFRDSETVEAPSATQTEQSSLMDPEIPAPPAMPQLEAPTAAPSIPPRSTPPRSTQPKERTWMSSRTPHPSAITDQPGSLPPERAVSAEPQPLPSLEPEAADAAPTSPISEPVASGEMLSERERSSEPLPISEERVVVSADSMDERPAMQAAASGGRASSRASGSLRPPADVDRPHTGRSERPSGRPNRLSGPPRVGDRNSARPRPQSAPVSSPRGRTPSPVITGVRPKSASDRPEPLSVRTGSAPPRAIEALSPTMLDVPGSASRLSPLEAPFEKTWGAPTPLEAQPAPLDMPPPVEPGPVEAAAPDESGLATRIWNKVLDAQGTASGW
jgi:HD-like signal output (HDOD) protein